MKCVTDITEHYYVKIAESGGELNVYLLENKDGNPGEQVGTFVIGFSEDGLLATMAYYANEGHTRLVETTVRLQD